MGCAGSTLGGTEATGCTGSVFSGGGGAETIGFAGSIFGVEITGSAGSTFCGGGGGGTETGGCTGLAFGGAGLGGVEKIALSGGAGWAPGSRRACDCIALTASITGNRSPILVPG